MQVWALPGNALAYGKTEIGRNLPGSGLENDPDPIGLSVPPPKGFA